ncbi:MAG: GHKL domain-containing protein [Ruminococcaceae bacterium]|nr:GHKL domain-containing protein [Oscillospiraceae bacterium]
MSDKKVKAKKSGPENTKTLAGIQKMSFRFQIILITTLALFLGFAGIFINLQFETNRRDRNLQNVAEAIAKSPLLTEKDYSDEVYYAVFSEYLDSLKDTLEDIDVISVIGIDGKRLYHSSHELIGTVYDGTTPDFDANSEGYYTTTDNGPSGTQRRAYAAIYDEGGDYIGFVMAIMLMKNVKAEVLQIFLTFTLITIVAILMELLISAELSGKIKESLLGYEPDVFTSMFRMRDNILESLDEGIVAVDSKGEVQFVNKSATEMLKSNTNSESLIGRNIDLLSKDIPVLGSLNNPDNGITVSSGDDNILIDTIPIKEGDEAIGTVGILHDRKEYIKLMEDLTGTRYLVDSMRANNHDFTNKLHVILGLIQMEMYNEATSYIQNITMVQRETISKVMNCINEPSVAALLIGKIARASELNVRFILREGCYYSPADIAIPSEIIVTVIGNLIDNAFDSMNDMSIYDGQKELMFGIYSKPGALLITADDTGCGISEKNMEHIFENGFSTKGNGRGTGLYQVKTITENAGGSINVESQEGVGTSFTVSFKK